MYGFDSIGGINRLAHVVGVFEIGRERGPLVPPGLDDHGIFVAPPGFQLVQSKLGGVECGGLVDGFQVGHKGFLVFRGDVLHRVPDLMNDAVLDLGVGVDRFDGFRKAFEAIGTGNQDVFDAPVIKVGENAEPVVSAFLVGEVETKQLFFALDIQGKERIDGLADIAAILFDFVVNGAKPDNGVNGFQITLTPGLQLRYQFVGDGVDGAVG